MLAKRGLEPTVDHRNIGQGDAVAERLERNPCRVGHTSAEWLSQSIDANEDNHSCARPPVGGWVLLRSNWPARDLRELAHERFLDHEVRGARV